MSRHWYHIYTYARETLRKGLHTHEERLPNGPVLPSAQGSSLNLMGKVSKTRPLSKMKAGKTWKQTTTIVLYRLAHRLVYALWSIWLVHPLPKNPWLLRRLSSPPLNLHFYIIVSEYGKDGADTEIVLLKRKGKIDVRSTSVADFIRENILKQKSY